MARNLDDMSWKGPTDSPDYPILMLGTVVICALGFLSSVFSWFDMFMVLVVIAGGVCVIYRVTGHIIRERRLDHDAFYGPITEEEEHNHVDR